MVTKFCVFLFLLKKKGICVVTLNLIMSETVIVISYATDDDDDVIV
jgi:hypothetical protein